MLRKYLHVVATAAALLAFSLPAQAGGFANRDQSAVGEGMSFAGEGTPGTGLSAMFWNPAAVTQATGWGAEAHVSYRMPRSSITTDPAATSPTIELLNTCGTGFCDRTGNIFENQIIPAFYGAYRLNSNWYLGLSVTQPFGFSTRIPDTGSFTLAAGTGPSTVTQQLATSAKISSIDVNPIVGWKITNGISVGIGPQFLWLQNSFNRDLFQLPSVANFDSPVSLETRGFGVGLTAGITVTPTPTTEVALGYRSRVSANLSGHQFFTPNALLTAAPGTAPLSGATLGVDGNITLPDQVSLGGRQRITRDLTLLGTVEWTHWSVLQNISYAFNNYPATVLYPSVINFNYRDGWFFSAGAEYQLSPDTKLRAGVGYEISPVRGSLGWVALPEANSTSLSAGFSHKLTGGLTVDFGYSYKWIDSQTILVGPGNPDQSKLITLIPGVFNTWGGSTSGHDQAVSLALRYAFPK